MGIGPTLAMSQTAVLPLHYGPHVDDAAPQLGGLSQIRTAINAWTASDAGRKDAWLPQQPMGCGAVHAGLEPGIPAL